MTKRPLFYLTASVLATAAITPAAAQDSDFADECVDLFAYVEDTPSLNLDDAPEIVAIIERNDARACNQRLALLRREGQTTTQTGGTSAQERLQQRSRTRVAPVVGQEQDRETVQQTEREAVTTERTVTEEVQVQETVTVRGDVDVVAPLPNVSVQQEPAQVAIQSEPPRVTVRQSQHSIVVREQPARITVGMPTITIEQDAPEIIITMPDPDIDVAMAEPQVEVRQAPPRVTVAVPEPRVDLNLTAGVGEGGEPVRTRIRRERGTATPQQGLTQVDSADANVFVGEAEPNVELSGFDTQPEVSFEGDRPQVTFENAEPNVQVEGEPEVRFERRGEPTIRFEQAGGGEERQQRFAGRADRNERAEADTPERPVAAASPAIPAATTTMTVGKLVGQDVYGANGEEIGSIDRVVRMDGRTYAIVEHGGFLGLGDTDIPLELTELTMNGDRLTATNLTEERAEAMQANDIERGENVRRGEAVRLGR